MLVTVLITWIFCTDHCYKDVDGYGLLLGTAYYFFHCYKDVLNASCEFAMVDAQ